MPGRTLGNSGSRKIIKSFFEDLLHLTQDQEEKLIGTHSAFGHSLKILQLAHSGRYARPGYNNPLRMYRYDPLDFAYGQNQNDGSILSDEELDALPETYEKIAEIAKEIGFDGVDIKCCHRYLLSELLSAFTRFDSPYGGEQLENRTRLYESILDRVISKLATPRFMITTRLNLYDGIPYPFGWGTIKKDVNANANSFTNQMPPPPPDMTEPMLLLTKLYEKGVRMVNLTSANPYFNPAISRPFDLPAPGIPIPMEHPLEGVNRFLALTREVKVQLPVDFALIGTGYSWLRQYAPYVAAAEISQNHVDFVGMGRMAFANPTFPSQIFLDGGNRSE